MENFSEKYSVTKITNKLLIKKVLSSNKGIQLPFYSSISHFFLKVNKDIYWIIFFSAAIIKGCGQPYVVSTTIINGCKCPIMARCLPVFQFSP